MRPPSSLQCIQKDGMPADIIQSVKPVSTQTSCIQPDSLSGRPGVEATNNTAVHCRIFRALQQDGMGCLCVSADYMPPHAFTACTAWDACVFQQIICPSYLYCSRMGCLCVSAASPCRQRPPTGRLHASHASPAQFYALSPFHNQTLLNLLSKPWPRCDL